MPEKASEGVQCRVLVGDQNSDAVRLRAEEEGTTGGLEGRIQLHRLYLRALRGLPGIEVRTHGTTLYNSLYRFDEDLLVNTPRLRRPRRPLPVPAPASRPRRPHVGPLHAVLRRGLEASHPGGLTSAAAVGHAGAMARVDYYNDPDAPKANSVVPSVTVGGPRRRRSTAAHPQDRQRLLGAARAAAMDLGESIADAAVREVAEETGLTVELTGLVGIYTDPGHVMAYDDGEVRQEFSVCFHARVTRRRAPRGRHRDQGRPAGSTSRHVDQLSIHPSMRAASTTRSLSDPSLRSSRRRQGALSVRSIAARITGSRPAASPGPPIESAS